MVWRELVAIFVCCKEGEIRVQDMKGLNFEENMKGLDMVRECETRVDCYGGDKEYVKTELGSSSKATNGTF